jgi:hypothetical protein
MTPETVFKEWEKHGIAVSELQDVVEIRQHGEVVARFPPLVPFAVLRKEVQRIIEENVAPERNPSNEQRRVDRSGAELREEGKFCSSCGTRVSEVDPESATQVKYPHQVATVLGYLFGFLGGWLGLVFGIYLVTRERRRAKDQGKIILSVTGVMIILWMFILLG